MCFLQLNLFYSQEEISEFRKQLTTHFLFFTKTTEKNDKDNEGDGEGNTLIRHPPRRPSTCRLLTAIS
jgi:hypothetical protein